MDPAVDPFQPLLRTLQRYRRDVHLLREPAEEASIREAEAHLGHALPIELAGFLRRWNGGGLFRGALYLRASYELAPPSQEQRDVVIVADGPGDRRWAYAWDGQGGTVIGEWDGERLLPLHDRFHRWLFGTIRVLDEDLREPEAALQARLECDPDSGYLLLALGERTLSRGDPEAARVLYQRATTADPGLVRAWQRLGELCLADGDLAQARFSLLRALRSTRLPPPFPGADLIEPGALITLSGLFPSEGPLWIAELERFIEERLVDVRDAFGWRLYEEAVLSASRALGARGERPQARDICRKGLERAAAFVWKGGGEALWLELASLSAELGEHDEAERHLRRLRAAEDPTWRARGDLALARIAVQRQEPWAEEILEPLGTQLQRMGERGSWALLRGERALSRGDLHAAAAELATADALAVRANDPVLQSSVCLALGDLARALNEPEQAEAAYQAAGERAIEAEEPELRLRVRVRQGDAALMRGDRTAAAAAYLEAARRYRELHLPLREARVLLRLVRATGHPEAAARARSLFRRMGLPRDLQVLDDLVGDDGRTLEWHLNHCAEHSRARHEASRSRPPLTRADADRPERRLGAHRATIASLSAERVANLIAELRRMARQLESSQARALDPSVTRYMAAADLLSHHRSLEAAQILLEQLFERRLPEIPARSLRGSVTRSANTALVDGLLQAVEHPTDPRAIAAAAEVLGWRRESAALPAIRSLLDARWSLPVRRAAVMALGRIGERGSGEDLYPLLGESFLVEEVAVAMLLLGDRRGVDFHAQALAAGTDLSRPPGEIVGRYGGPSYLLLLFTTADRDGASALGALQGMGYLGDPRAVGRLLQALTRREPDVLAVASGALSLITGHREDPDEPGLQLRWARWWETNGHRFQEGVRYRDGEPMTPQLLVAKLGDDDPLVRRGAYDELVITTGCQLPFDSDGPWRVQLAHRRAWERWCLSAGLPAGGWWFDGGVIA